MADGLSQIIAELDRLIAANKEKLATLTAARDVIVAEGGGMPAREPQKLLAAPAGRRRSSRVRRGRKATPSNDAGLVHDEIDGVTFPMTPEQSRFLQLLGEHDYVSPSLWLPLWGGKLSRGKWAINDLRARMEAAKVPAEIAGYRNRGFRLETKEGAQP